MREGRSTSRRLRAEVSGDRVEVTLESATTCRSVTEVPMRRRRDEERTSESPVLVNLGLGTAAVALLALGTGLIVMKCPNCQNAGDTTEIRALGAVTLVSSLLPISVMIVHAAQTKDRHALVPADPDLRAGAPRPCGVSPVAEEEITLEVGDAHLRASTDASGRASFGVAVGAGAKAPRAVVRARDAPEISVDLSCVPGFDRSKNEDRAAP